MASCPSINSTTLELPFDWGSDPASKLRELSTVIREALYARDQSTGAFMSQVYEALRSYPQPTEDADVGSALNNLAWYHYLNARPEAALDPAADAVRCAERVEDPQLAIRAHLTLGSMLGETHNATAAVSELYKALVLAKRHGDASLQAKVWGNLGAIYMNSGQLNESVRMFAKAIALSSADDPSARINAYTNIALVALQTKDIAAGIKACNAALAEAGEPRSVMDYVNRAQTESNLAQLLIAADQKDAALAHARTAREFSAKAQSEHAAIEAALAEALAEIASGHKDIGLSRLKQTIEKARQGSPAAFRYVLMSGIQGYELAGEPEVALMYWKELAELNRRTVGAGLLHHLRSELRDVDLELGARADAALLDQEHALLRAQSDPLRARIRFGLYERASVGAELHDDETGYHVFRVGAMSREIARRLRLSQETCEIIDYSARLHDLGKITLPEGLLMKPGRFTPGERAIMETHTIEGARLIREGSEGLASMHIAEEIAVGHHEKFDGTGYPNKLRGNLIPISARIVALADVFDALTHARCYKTAWTITDSLREIAQQRGKHFDPELTDIFLNLVPELLREHGDLETYLSAAGRDNEFVRDRAAINSELRGANSLFLGGLDVRL